MSRIAILLLVLAVHAATAVNGQTPERPRVFLLVIDDLHLDFRETPRTRALLQQILATLAKDGDVWSVVSTGTSSLTLAPTADLAAVRAAVRRMTGNALTTNTRLGVAAAAEHRRRAEVTYQTAADAISPIAAVPNRGALTVLYVSGGYDTRVAAPPSAVVEAATRVQARVIPIFTWPWWSPDPAAGVPFDKWQAYVAATQDSLRTLATETSGFAVLTPSDLEPALRTIEPQP